ncbi:endolytic transglycosylase MltG [Arthrobacter sp. H20]|uniref:endolytic transglycosylase MltG n=1 Tax=Arthrobacter sp. H20 TaxID=1267981 RepID=UPI000479E6F0|nr:endolytic transglycosylase MltG [Arthrobacter sp. H20]
MSHHHPQFPAADSEPERHTGDDQHADGYDAGHDGFAQPVEQFFDAGSSQRRNRRPSKAKQRRRRRRTVVMLVVVLAFVGVVVAVSLMLRDLLGLDDITDYAGPGEGSVVFTVSDGAGPLAIGTGLQAEDIVADGAEFVSALQQVADGREVQPGEYELSYQMSSEGAALALLDVEANQVHYAAVAQGLRQGETLDILAESTTIPREEFDELAADPTQFGLPEEATSLEGYLAPGEYRFDVDATATEMIQIMVDASFALLEDAGVTDPEEQFRILTIGSIIEAEAGEADYGAVSGAIENRLQEDNTETNGLIQSDATVTYGLDRRSFDFTEEERGDESNPYNTFANPGLPVGPIGSPGAEAIDAAVNPADVPFYYWVTVDLDTGETKFSETLAEHAVYVAEYQAWCADNPGRCS